MMKMAAIADSAGSLPSVPATIPRALPVSPHFTSTGPMR